MQHVLHCDIVNMQTLNVREEGQTGTGAEMRTKLLTPGPASRNISATSVSQTNPRSAGGVYYLIETINHPFRYPQYATKKNTGYLQLVPYRAYDNDCGEGPHQGRTASCMLSLSRRIISRGWGTLDQLVCIFRRSVQRRRERGKGHLKKGRGEFI